MTTTAEPLTRQQLLDSLLFNVGGDGYGVSSVGNMFASLMKPPKEIKSAVLIGIRADTPEEKEASLQKFTDEELQHLVRMIDQCNAAHKRMLGEILESDNLYTVRRNEYDGKVYWTYSRRTWTTGPVRVETLDELESRLLRRQPSDQPT